MRSFKSVFRIVVASVPLALLLLIMAALLCSNPVIDRSVSCFRSVAAGTADLAGCSTGLTRLDGDWSFWWERQVRRPGDLRADAFCRLPGSWMASGIAKSHGYASYGLEVTGLDPERQYALCVGHTLSACRILINGEEVCSAGSPGISLDTEIPGWGTLVARFTPAPDGSAGIVLQISNFRDRFGGSNASLYLGEASLVYRMVDTRKLSEGFVFSVLVVLGLLFFVLYLFRRKDRHFLWFAGIGLVVAFRTLCYDSFVLLDLLPFISWPVFFRLGYLTFPAVIICFIGFIHSVYPRLLPRGQSIAIQGVFALYALVILLPGESLAPVLLLPYQLFGVAAVGFGMSVIVRACRQGQEGALWLAAGFSFAVVTFAYDILVSMWIVSGVSLSHLGVSLCLFCIALMVVDRYSRSFRRAHEISEELVVLNRSLKRFVPEDLLACFSKDSLAEIRSGDAVDAEMAILSASIRSLDSIASKMPPDAVFAFLNDFLELVGPVVRSNGGFIARYEGDGILALFPSGAEPAVRCAVQMQSAVAARNRKQTGRTPIAIGIGIDSGRLTLGAIGDSLRLDGTVIAHGVRSAEQFQVAAREFQARILINGTVFSQLPDPLAWFLRPVERIETDGQPSFLFEVYNNDQELTRELKWKTQGDLEHAVLAYFGGAYGECGNYLKRVLRDFPDDPVALHYARRVQM